MSQNNQQRSGSLDSTAESIRKRVCKACDRCRLKKSKCDGASPCSRCKADNAICVFGERKKSHDKVYPKGYVEMLEQQQGQLVSGLQEMYHRLLAGQRWAGPTLSEASGHPLTHDILAALDLLESKADGTGDMETFEEDCVKLQSRLYQAGAPSVRRKGSFSSESEHSQHAASISTAQTTPSLGKVAVFKDNLTLSPSPSPLTQSPPPSARRPTFPMAHHQQQLQQPPSPLIHDPQLFQPEWAISGVSNPEAILRSKYAMQTPRIEQTTFIPDAAVIDTLGGGDSWLESSQFASSFEFGAGAGGGVVDPMDIDFNRWITTTV